MVVLLTVFLTLGWVLFLNLPELKNGPYIYDLFRIYAVILFAIPHALLFVLLLELTLNEYN